MIDATRPRPAYIQPHQKYDLKVENTTIDDVEAVRNILEQMIFLLLEEQSSGKIILWC